MGIVKRTELYQHDMDIPTRLSQLKEWFDQFNCSLISTEILEESNYLIVTVDDKIDLCIQPSGEGRFVFLSFGVVKTDEEPATTYTISADSMFGAKMYIGICISNSAVFFVGDDTRANNYNHYAFLYEKIGVDSYYGSRGASDENVSTTYLRQVSIQNYATQVIYSHSASLNYACAIGMIDYTPTSIIKNTTETLNDPNFLSCSTVVPLQVYTFNNMNYYAVDENTLVLSNNSLE